MSNKYDVAVIGGGPAGMMAAGRAAELGARVVLLEKNNSLGNKLSITGGGRCNITNNEPDIRKLVAKYGLAGKALHPVFFRFGVTEALDFFHGQGLKTKVEAEQRVFPATEKATDVVKTMAAFVKKGKVQIILNADVAGLEKENGRVSGVRTNVRGKSEIIEADNFIIATGGMSRPETGSTGDGFKWLADLGHKIIQPDMALVPLVIKEPWVKQLSGLSLPDARLTVWQNNERQESRVGKILFTHFGLSGPLVLNMSRGISEMIKYGPVTLTIDLMPTLDPGALDKKILEIFTQNQNRQIKNVVTELVPPKLRSLALTRLGVNPAKTVNLISREERLRLVKFLKEMKMTVAGLLGSDKAIITSGGVMPNEVDFKTMQSKLFPNLFLAGDVLDFDRPSGGFSLQLCWSTGYVAGENAAKLGTNTASHSEAKS